MIQSNEAKLMNECRFQDFMMAHSIALISTQVGNRVAHWPPLRDAEIPNITFHSN